MALEPEQSAEPGGDGGLHSPLLYWPAGEVHRATRDGRILLDRCEGPLPSHKSERGEPERDSLNSILDSDLGRKLLDWHNHYAALDDASDGNERGSRWHRADPGDSLFIRQRSIVCSGGTSCAEGIDRGFR